MSAEEKYLNEKLKEIFDEYITLYKFNEEYTLIKYGFSFLLSDVYLNPGKDEFFIKNKAVEKKKRFENIYLYVEDSYFIESDDDEFGQLITNYIPYKIKRKWQNLKTFLIYLAIGIEKAKGNKKEVEKIVAAVEKEGKKLKVAKQDIQAVTRYIQSTSKVTNPKYLVAALMRKGALFNVGGKNENKVQILVRFDDNENEVKLSGIDEIIFSAVVSLWDAERKNVTIKDIAKVAYSIKRPTKKQLETVEERIDAMSETRIDIDWTDELRGNLLDGEEIKKCKYTGYLLPMEKIEIVATNGCTTIGYKILDEPILFTHDKQMHQYMRVNNYMLEEATESISSTETNLLIRSYLLRRTVSMKRNHQLVKKINFSAIAEAIGKENPTRTEKSRIRNIALEYLRIFKKYEHIKDFKIRKGANKEIIGIEIEI